MLEFAIIVPFMLFLTFGIIQLALLFVAHSLMEYAAFCAARAELVREINPHGAEYDTVDPQVAAEMVCSLISFDTQTGDGHVIPGWHNGGYLRGSRYATHENGVGEKNTKVTIVDLSETEFNAQVDFKYQLYFPELALPFLGIYDYGIELEKDASKSYIVLSSNCSMVRSF